MIPETIQRQVNDLLIDFALDGDPAMCEWLVGAGAEVNAGDIHGMTALHHAAVEGYVETAKTLLRLGADIDAEDEDGLTPADMASDENIKVLLGHDNGKYLRFVCPHCGCEELEVHRTYGEVVVAPVSIVRSESGESAHIDETTEVSIDDAEVEVEYWQCHKCGERILSSDMDAFKPKYNQ